MEIETLYKYINFLKKECERHSIDDNINDDEINQLNLEIKKFQELVNGSNVSDYIKSEITKIDFNLNETNHNKLKYTLLRFISGSYGNEFIKQENRKNRFEKLSLDLENLIFKLKLNS